MFNNVGGQKRPRESDGSTSDRSCSTAVKVLTLSRQNSGTSAGSATPSPPTLMSRNTSMMGSRSNSSTSPPSSISFADRLFPRVLAALKLPHNLTPSVIADDEDKTIEVTDDVRAALAKDICGRIADHGKDAGVQARFLVPALENAANTVLRYRLLRSSMNVEPAQFENDESTPSSLSPAEFVALPATSLDLMPDDERKKAVEIKEQKSRNRNIQALKEALANPSSLWRCPKCKSKKCSFNEQSRRGDEPIKIVCTCLECGTVFKR